MPQDTDNDALKQSLIRAGLVPGPAEDLLRDFKPTVNLEVSYAGKPVELGTLFSASACEVAPAISFAPEGDDVGSRASYTLILVDCDASSSEDKGFCRHWVLPGLTPLASSSEHIVAETKFALTPYLGPTPDDGSDPHRCLFLLYREPRNLDMSKDDLDGDEPDQRRNFKPSVFAEQHGLVLVGVNWMRCSAD
ncbi:PEBP-like protein [Coniochaeta ligniaria NRRL 30616]|uniref:PEBP-like protein n=1 Tax=Coniochaeta ligniaria NRRL 30616 TaxID=1408157 RepID=A0A1J7J7A8_9PEZI|nr:PEBP-like protein [Coniochaeta ligniaria NRRL 30616]